MHNWLKISYSNVVVYLEDKCSTKIDREVHFQQLKYVRNRECPGEQDCFRLRQNLFELQGQNSRLKVFFLTTGKDTMHCTAWMIEPVIEDYEQYGIVPGVCIDCKALSNRFRCPLLTINGRTPDGKVCTLFMGFLRSETEPCFRWMLQRFRSANAVPPYMVVLDQNAAMIAAVRAILPNRFLYLDEWHLKNNQLKNTATWCTKILRPSWAEIMSDDLHGLRRCCDLEVFKGCTGVFEKYFTSFGVVKCIALRD